MGRCLSHAECQVGSWNSEFFLKGYWLQWQVYFPAVGVAKMQSHSLSLT